jgi:hypothetical protein
MWGYIYCLIYFLVLLSGDQIWYGLDMGLINTFSRLVALMILSFQGLADASGIEWIFTFWGGGTSQAGTGIWVFLQHEVF